MFEIIIYILLILSLIYGFYFLIMASGVFRKKKCEIDNNKKNHFAILIAARNEETVIKIPLNLAASSSGFQPQVHHKRLPL